MDIPIERDGGTAVLMIQGRIDGSNAMEFQENLQGTLTETDQIVVLDFGELTYISSAGLRVLLMVAKELSRRSGSLAVCSLSESVQEVFQVSGFDKIIMVRASKEEAVAAIKG